MDRLREIERGTTKGFEVKIKNDGVLVTVDAMYFSVKLNTETEDVIFQKKLGSGITLKEGAYYIVVNPEDTENMEYGNYFYDIKYIQDGLKKVIEKGVLSITDVVTFASNEV